MAKNKISEWSSTPANNTDVGGINIAEGCAPSNLNNAIREVMAQVKDMQTGADSDNFVVGGAFTCSGAAVFSSTVSLGSSATASTQTQNDNSTKVATTEYVDSGLGNKVDYPVYAGFVAKTGSGTVEARTITAGSGISITNGNGVSDNPTITNTGVLTVDGSIGDITIDVGAKIAALDYGAVGTYVYGYIATSSVSAGSTYSGSSIYPAGGHATAAISAGGGVTAYYSRGSNALSGTWRAMGESALTSSSPYKLTLFLRIS